MQLQWPFVKLAGAETHSYKLCAREVWLTCAIWDITLTVAHMASEELMSSADALSHWNTGHHYKDCVSHLILDRRVTLLQVPTEVFILPQSI